MSKEKNIFTQKYQELLKLAANAKEVYALRSERKQLFEELKSLAPNHKLKRGSLVIDCLGQQGIVVKIEKGSDVQNHGRIFVWLLDSTNCTYDNCEYYCEFGWENSLIVIEK